MFRSKKYSLRYVLSTHKLLTFLVTHLFFLTACSNIPPKSSSLSLKELRLIEHPPKSTLQKIDNLMPAALRWYKQVENSLYPKGRKLSGAEKKQAKQFGIINPDLIRVVILEKFPEPNNKTVNNHFEGARAMGNVIMIKPQHQNNSVVLCHELVHIAQIDRLGLKQFLKRYAIEHEIVGYSRSLLENEAYARQQIIQ